jgi:hypothetical protein
MPPPLVVLHRRFTLGGSGRIIFINWASPGFSGALEGMIDLGLRSHQPGGDVAGIQPSPKKL